MEIRGLELADDAYPIEEIVRLTMTGKIHSVRTEVFFKEDKMFYWLDCEVSDEVGIRGLGLVVRKS